VLRAEASALLAAADRLDPGAFAAAVQVLLATGSTVHVMGAGTSGVIARKLAATLTSTGTPAAFLHPGDALHGGLGAVAEESVVVAVSNSGETEELLALLPYLTARGVRIVAVVGNAQSTLAQRAAAVLDARADVEACALGLAPTSSSTLALAVCDALAVALMGAKGVTSSSFARNHPSGQLGRRLTLRVSDLMTDAVTCPVVRPDDDFLEVIKAIGKSALGGAPVVEDRRLVGIVTDGDVRRAVERYAQDELLSVRAAAFMTAQPVQTEPDALAYDALRAMEDRPSQISLLPVVSSAGELVGMLRLHDLVRAGL
jgi:arabinose-5-phosphate isomerase